ncbi:MAG: DUF177 domain-containing protein [Myxococcota bacterium]
MRVHVDTIGKDGFDFDEPIDEEWIGGALGDGSPYTAANSGHLKVHLERKRQAVVQARGSLKLAVKVDCSRCLHPVEIEFTHALDVVLFPAGSEPAAGTDGELDGADIGVATYEDGVVDLSALVRDEIFLEMPMTPTCENADPRDCEHFMANLGPLEAELEVGEPTPEEKPVDPRWAALGKLKGE